MPDYEKLYHRLFAAMDDAVELMDSGNLSSARQTLIDAMLAAEEEYINEG